MINIVSNIFRTAAVAAMFNVLPFAVATAQTTYEPYAVSLLAGATGVIGSADGSSAAARFNAPQAIAVDRNGNIYVADTGNHTIRKVASSGATSTLAGFAGVSGSNDGNGSDARFELPQGIAVDEAGNVYVSDTGNRTMRKITPNGDVTTLAGAVHQTGSTDGSGNVARFGYPIGIAVDPSGNLYVADNGNNTVRMISSSGSVSTMAGLSGTPGSSDGMGTAARFNVPSRVAWDTFSNVLYVADTGNNTIRQITPSGVVSTIAGLSGTSGSVDGNGTAARFDGPRGVTVDNVGNIYISATNSHTIRKIHPGGAVTTLAGSPGSSGGTDGYGGNARFNFPYSLAADTIGNIFVADTINHTIRVALPPAERFPLRIALQAPPNKLLTGQAFPNIMIEISATADLTTPFQTLVTVLADGNGVFQYSDNATTKHFYRAALAGNLGPRFSPQPASIRSTR